MGEEDKNFWKSECISRKRNLSLNSEGNAVVNIADPNQRQLLALKDKDNDAAEASGEYEEEEWEEEEWEDSSMHEEMKVDSENEKTARKFSTNAQLPKSKFNKKNKNTTLAISDKINEKTVSDKMLAITDGNTTSK